MSGLDLIRSLLVGGRLRSCAGADAGAGDGSSGGKYTRGGRTGWRSSTFLVGVVVVSEGGEEIVCEPRVVVVLTSPSETYVALDTIFEPGMKGLGVKLGLVVLCVNPLKICHFTGA